VLIYKSQLGDLTEKDLQDQVEAYKEARAKEGSPPDLPSLDIVRLAAERNEEIEVIDDLTPEPEPAPIPVPQAPDFSVLDNNSQVIKACVLAAAAMSGKSPAQAAAAFKTAWDSLNGS
jgi:hypothetical protein